MNEKEPPALNIALPESTEELCPSLLSPPSSTEYLDKDLKAENECLTADNSFSESPKEAAVEIFETEVKEAVEQRTSEEDFSFLSQDLKKIPRKKAFFSMLGMVKTGFVLSVTNLSIQMIQSLAMILLNLNGDSYSQAIVGVALTFNSIFYFGFFLAFVEKLGIDLSKSFGAKKYFENKKVFTQGLLTAILWVLFLLVPIFLSGASILRLMGIKENMIVSVDRVLPIMLVANVIELIGDVVRNFCMAQGHESIFGKTSIVAMIVALAFEAFFIIVLEYGALSFFYAKMIFEILALAIALVIYARRTEPATRGLVSLKQTLPGLARFNWVSFKFSVGNYAEFLGYEITSYFVFLSKNEAHIAAYSSIMNFMSMFYSIGEVFSIVCRTRMNVLLGKGKWQGAKNIYILFVMSVFGFGCLLSLFFLAFHEKVIALYADSNPEMHQTFTTLFLIYCAAIPSDLTVITVFIGLKTIGYINCLLLTNILYIIVLNGCLNYSIFHLTDWGVPALFTCLVTIFYSLNISSFTMACRLSWKNAQPEED